MKEGKTRRAQERRCGQAEAGAGRGAREASQGDKEREEEDARAHTHAEQHKQSDGRHALFLYRGLPGGSGRSTTISAIALTSSAVALPMAKASSATSQNHTGMHTHRRRE